MVIWVICGIVLYWARSLVSSDGVRWKKSMEISIKSGFRRGGSLLRWDGSFRAVKTAYENTNTNDGDSSFSVIIPDDFVGAVLRWWGISPFTSCTLVQLLGFTEAELGSPSPIRGWVEEQSSCLRATNVKQMVTRCDWLRAIAAGGAASITTFSQAWEKGEAHPLVDGLRLWNQGKQAGDQQADAWVVLRKVGGEGEITVIGGEQGVGDNTPTPVLGDTGWRFTSNAHGRFVEEEEDREILREQEEIDGWAMELAMA